MKSHKKESVNQLFEHLFRSEYGRLVAFLARLLGLQSLTSAEDIAQDVLLSAYKDWTYRGIPNNPSAWLFAAARNRAKNLFKRHAKWREIIQRFPLIEDDERHLSDELVQGINDSMLRMMFVCAAPSLPTSSAIMLMLNILCGFSRKEISRAFIMEEEAIKKRLFRAKRKVRSEGLSLELPPKEVLRHRLDRILACLYLLYNEGYNASIGDEIIRRDVCYEAIRLLKIVIKHFDDYHAAHALLALMYFHTARFSARIDDNGAIVLFGDQPRSEWDRELIVMGLNQLELAAGGDCLSSYHLEAAIASEHCVAKNFATTNWQRIKSYYLTLREMEASPIIDLNLAIVESRLGNRELAIEMMHEIANQGALTKYHLFYATLGSLYENRGDCDLAHANYLQALRLTSTAQEKEIIMNKLQRL